MKTGSGFLIAVSLLITASYGDSGKNPRHHNVSTTPTTATTSKLPRHEPDCVPDAPGAPNKKWRCFNYNGSLSYGQTCISADEKREEYIKWLDPLGNGTPREADAEAKLLQLLDAKSCNTSQYLECRRISDKVIPNQLPLYRCACPDHEKGDSHDAVTKSESYFDRNSSMCVLKVRAKCTNLTIPDDDKRLNGSRRYLTKNMTDVVDGRRQWLTLPCVPNARCKIQKAAPTTKEERDKDHDGLDDSDGSSILSRTPWTAIDPSKNRCTCDSGYIIENGEDGRCYPIDGTGSEGLHNKRGAYPLGIILLVVALAVTLWIMLVHDQNDMYWPPGYTRY